MASTKVKGIIIESKDFKDKDKSVVIYTLEQGKVRAVFKGVRGEKAKLKASKEMFTFGDFFIENTKGNNIISQVDVIESFYPLSQELDKYYEACSIIDICKKLGTEQSDPAFFIEILKALKTLCYFNVKKHYVLIKFLLSIFESTGYPINLEKCASCKAKITGKKYLNLEFGEIVCANCKTFSCEEISPSVFSAIKILKQSEYERLQTINFGGEAEKETLRILVKNFEERFSFKIFVAI